MSNPENPRGWAAGDLALCVRDDWENDGDRPDLRGLLPPAVGKGALLEVTRVVWPQRDYPAFAHLLRSVEYLCFDVEGRYGYRSDWFRKIEPHTPDAEDLRTITEINSGGLLTVCDGFLP